MNGKLTGLLPTGHHGRGLSPSIVPRSGPSSGGLACVECGSPTQVTDSRPTKEGRSVRRVRCCINPACGRRFTTYETEGSSPAAPGVALAAYAVRLRKLADTIERHAVRLGFEPEDEA